MPERVHEVRGEPSSWPSFDAVVCTVGDLQRLGRPLRTSFAFILGEDTQLLFANAGNITETFLIDLVQGRSSVPSAWLWGYEGVEYEGTVARLSRVYQPAVSVLSDVRVVVDVRAGVGVASACFRTLHPEAAIHCFEVDPLALHLLRQNILSLGNCFVHSVGLAGQDSCRTRRLWPEDPQAEWGVEQLLPFREARAA
ncbi:glycosyl transferase family 1, partial [Synechococcus sp. R6-5]